VGFAVVLARESMATVDVIDAAGRRAATVFSGTLPAGEHALRWDARTPDGRAAAPGIYHVRLRAGGLEESRTFSLVR